MTSTFTNETKHAATVTQESRGTSGAVLATAGMAMGLMLAIPYAGGEILTAGSLPTFTNETKH